MERWYLHPLHGYMLRQEYAPGYDWVVMALCLNTRETEEDPAAWEAHKSRLYVNAGSGAVCADGMRSHDHNPDFKRIRPGKVPAHIRAEFLAYVYEPSEV